MGVGDVYSTREAAPPNLLSRPSLFPNCTLSLEPCSPSGLNTSTNPEEGFLSSSTARHPFLAVFCHRRDPAWFEEAFLCLCRLRGRHTVPVLQQSGEKSENGAARAVGEADGAGVLGAADQDRQGHCEEFPSELAGGHERLQPQQGW